VKYFYLTFLVLVLSYSCVSKQRYEAIVAKNNKLNQMIQTTDSLSNEIKNLEFRIKNLEFNLGMCETKLRRQDRKLIECINMKGSCK